jgi:hypothetical protein
MSYELRTKNSKLTMVNKLTEKTSKATSKSFLAVGPTLHYSHGNVQRCWLLAVIAYGLCCLFFSNIVTGAIISFDIESLASGDIWRIGQVTVGGVSIFEYPWQIVVLGLLMGILAISPILISQLMSFSYSLIFILEVFFLANLPGFAVSLLISCFAVACRPLRFRSRYIAIALCTAPQLLYWGFFGGLRGVEPIQWGFSFAPWISAWLNGLIIAAIVLGIGHYTRYRPGLVWIVTFLVFLVALLLFERKIGFDELDYQLYVAKNNPEHTTEFHDHSITEALDETIKEPGVRKYLSDFFYPTEPIQLREELKREIQEQLEFDRWPSWFIVPDELRYEQKRQWLNEQYELFIDPPKPWWMPTVFYNNFLYPRIIEGRSGSERMPITLYFKALLSEYTADIGLLGRREILHFYSDYPQERSREIWYRLYAEFGDSAESVEARWRIAKHWAGQGRFEKADELLSEGQIMIRQRLEMLDKEKPASEALFSLFRSPPHSIMTAVKLIELQSRMNQLRLLISSENRTGEPEGDKCLAEFVMLNPHSLDYAQRLRSLLERTSDNGRLRDNILLAQIKLITDEQRQSEQLSRLHSEFQNTDGGMQALYELGLLKISLWRQQGESSLEQKKKFLADARATLSAFMNFYPDSFFAEQVKKNLDNLPTIE